MKILANFKGKYRNLVVLIFILIINEIRDFSKCWKARFSSF